MAIILTDLMIPSVEHIAKLYYHSVPSSPVYVVTLDSDNVSCSQASHCFGPVAMQVANCATLGTCGIIRHGVPRM